MAKIPRVPVENQITTLSMVKIVIKFSPCREWAWGGFHIVSSSGGPHQRSAYPQSLRSSTKPQTVTQLIGIDPSGRWEHTHHTLVCRIQWWADGNNVLVEVVAATNTRSCSSYGCDFGWTISATVTLDIVPSDVHLYTCIKRNEGQKGIRTVGSVVLPNCSIHTED